MRSRPRPASLKAAAAPAAGPGGSGVAAAALESLAESFNDGVVAPAFWLFTKLLAINLPGLTNTGWL